MQRKWPYSSTGQILSFNFTRIHVSRKPEREETDTLLLSVKERVSGDTPRLEGILVIDGKWVYMYLKKLLGLKDAGTYVTLGGRLLDNP